MKNEEYWKKRQEEKLSSILNKSDVTSDYISKIYHKAYLYTKEQIQDVFDKYKESHGLSLQEAKLLLSQLNNPHDYDELKKKLQNNLTSEQRKELLKKLDAPAYQYRINRLKDMQSKVDGLMKNVYNIEVEKSTDSYIDSAFDAYYRNVYNFQQGTGVAYQFNELDPKLIDEMLHSKWSGKNYSSRVWSNTTNLANSLKEEMMLGLLTNKTEKEMADTIMNKFAVGAYRARRLVQTESAAMSAFADQLAYEDAGIEKEMFIAVHDSRTSKICQQHDRSIVDISKAQVGVNVPPLHPNCRSYMIPYIEGITDKMKKRQRNPETGRDEVVNVNENYEQWLKRQQQEHGIDNVDTFKEKTKGNHSKQKKKTLNETDIELLDDSLMVRIKNAVKSKVFKEKIVSFDGLPEELKKGFLDGLNKSDIFTQNLINSTYKNVSYAFDLNRLKSSANPVLNTIFLKSAEPSTLAHELYHIIDYKYKISDNSLLQSKLDRDYARLLEISQNDIKTYVKKFFPNAFSFESNSFIMKKEYRGISDIFSGLSGGRISFGYGHNSKYWEKKSNLYVIEAWAQYGRIGYDANEDVINMFVELFPEFSSEAVKISKRIGEK